MPASPQPAERCVISARQPRPSMTRWDGWWPRASAADAWETGEVRPLPPPQPSRLSSMAKLGRLWFNVLKNNSYSSFEKARSRAGLDCLRAPPRRCSRSTGRPLLAAAPPAARAQQALLSSRGREAAAAAAAVVTEASRRRVDAAGAAGAAVAEPREVEGTKRIWTWTTLTRSAAALRPCWGAARSAELRIAANLGRQRDTSSRDVLRRQRTKPARR